MEDVKSAFKLLGWYVVATYLFLPLLAAPFTAGYSLTGYFLPLVIFVPDKSEVGWGMIAGWLLVALLLWVIHLFLRNTIFRLFKRKYLAPPQYY